MIATIRRDALLDAAKKTACAAARETTVLPLKGMLVEADEAGGALRLTATDTSMAIRISVPAYVESGGAAVIANPRLFSEYLALAPSEDIRIRTNDGDGTMNIRIENRKASLDVRILPEKDYPKPEIPMPGETVCVSGLKSLLARSCFVASDEARQGKNGCVKIALGENGIGAEAANGFVLAKVLGDRDSKGNISLLLPVFPLKTFARITGENDVCELGVAGAGKNGKTAVFFDGTLLFSVRLAEDNVPDAEVVLNSLKEAVSVKVRAADLKEAFAGASAFAAQNDSIEMSFAHDGIRLKCETEKGSAESFAPATVKKSSDSPGIAYLYDAARLAECLRALNGELTLTISENGHIVLANGKAKYLQLARAPKRKQGSGTKNAAEAA